MKRASRARGELSLWLLSFAVSTPLAACDRSGAPTGAEGSTSGLGSAAQPRLVGSVASPPTVTLPSTNGAASSLTAAPATSDSPSALGACASLCKKSSALHCAKGAECAHECLAMFQLRACLAQVTDFVACLQREPLEHWECDEDGTAAIRDGFCGKEQAAIVECGNQPAR